MEVVAWMEDVLFSPNCHGDNAAVSLDIAEADNPLIVGVFSRKLLSH